MRFAIDVGWAAPILIGMVWGGLIGIILLFFQGATKPKAPKPPTKEKE